jgi:DMSO reductase family type II enzyme molybdopterin subunit
VREQTDLPLLVREDSGRLLRQADLEAGGKEDVLYFWDEVGGELAEAPGCQGRGGRSIALGSRRPALEGRFEVQLTEGQRVGVRPVFERLRDHLASYAPEQATRITGVAPSVVRQIAREMAAARSAMIFASWGACKHYHSDLFHRSMILLMALTGNQGRPGGGLRLGGWWALRGFDRLSGLEPHLAVGMRLGLLVKVLRGITPRDYETYFTEFSNERAITPLMPFLYVHAGYRDSWSRPEQADPALPRAFDHYVDEAIERGWVPIHPPPDRKPRVLVFVGSNPLRRWPTPQIARQHLWPKLDCVVAVNFRMSTTACYADYVLPAAAYYEKYSIKYAQSYVPYLIMADQAVAPQGEAKPEWEIFGRLVERIQGRARARNVTKVRGPHDKPLDLSRVYDQWSEDGRFDPAEPRKVMDHILRESGSLGGVGLEEALEQGAVRLLEAGPYTPIHQTSSDYRPDDTYYPHGWFLEKKLPWPTLSGRQQFFLDHPWFEEAGEVLPAHKDPPSVGSAFPLRLTGGHTRWSVHAIWRDHELMLQLQRGEPVCFVSPIDAAARGMRDGDRVRIRNDSGSFDLLAKLAPGVQPGQVIVYHAWEPYQFPGWKGQQDPVESPWKAIHLAGDYGQLHYRMYYGAPSHGPRGTPIELERIGTARAAAS